MSCWIFVLEYKGKRFRVPMYGKRPRLESAKKAFLSGHLEVPCSAQLKFISKNLSHT